MTAGIATPAAGQPTYFEHEAAERARYDREQQRQHWIELGAAALGYHQLPIRQDGQIIAYAWQQRQAEQVAGLPAPLVDAARRALAAEAGTRTVVLAKYAEARQYVSQHQLTDQAARTYAELHAAEAATAHRAAVALTPRALHDLGQLVEQAAQIRAVINAAPGKRRQIEEEYQRQLAAIDGELASARLAAQRLGLS